jgi:immune inhibitor A
MLQALICIVTFMFISLTAWMPSGTVNASETGTGELELPAGDSIAPPVTKLPTVAIGAMQPAGKRLVRPREEIVERRLRRQGKITPFMNPDQVRSALKGYYDNFSKKSSAWVSPEVQERALQRRTDPEPDRRAPAAMTSSAAGASTAVQPVTANILVLAVDFGGTDTFTYSGEFNGGCKTQTVPPAAASGPLQGQIPPPGPRDNNTIWYAPKKTGDAKFYEKLIFGTEGVGRVRLDLKDPVDGKPGINLSGYTVQDYYDHMAGTGNVALSGVVEGWLTVDHSEGYYGAPNCSKGWDDGGGPATPAHLVRDALEKFKEAHPDYYTDTSPDAFWKQFDANHDGYVDSLWIIHAGMGQEAEGGEQGELAIWSQSSSLRTWNYKVYEGDNSTPDDDIYAGPYTLQPENADLGVLVEEFGHNFFGLPDLYSTDIENSVGFWSIMSGGTWGGWLGGATPVGMPLWFRMIAQCGKDDSGKIRFCNWHEPIQTLPFNTPSTTAAIGRLESTPAGAYKGLKIDLPDVVDNGLENRAGSGKGAYTGTGLDNLDMTLDRKVCIGKNAVGRLTFQTVWDMEEDRDYGYVMVKSGNDWILLDDLDGVLRETNPYGTNLGHGLTGYGNQKLRFDLSHYRGKTLTLRFRYRTDASKTGPGWWIDNLRLDGISLSQFENAVAPSTFPGFVNSSPGWTVVPTATSYPNYYLVEWRTGTKYDKMLRTAYVTNYSDEDEWQVERVPYNIPGAVIYYCNTFYKSSYSLKSHMESDPSLGPKNPLLVVDMNYGPMRLGTTGQVLDARRASYDAALTLQPTKAFSISQIDTGSTILKGPWKFASKTAVTQFDDAKGYYAGLYAGSPCGAGKFCFANEGGSAVIPAFGSYTTRITHYDGTPYPELYGQVYRGSILGTGNPGDDRVQCGLRIRLLSKSADNSTAKLRINEPESQ